MKKKINFIDWLLIVLVLVVIIAGISYVLKDKGESGVVIGKKPLVFVAKSEGIRKEVAEAYNIGDKLVASERYQDGTIIKVDITPEKELVGIDGEIVARDIEGSFQVWVTIEAEVNQYGPYRDFGGQSIKVGEPYAINTKYARSNGYIVEIIEQEVTK